MSTSSDETPEGTLIAILHQGSDAIRARVNELINADILVADYMALIGPGGDTPEVRVFSIRMIQRETYAGHVQDQYPDVAQAVRAPVPEGFFRVVILCEGMIAVKELQVADEGPVVTLSINSRGGSA